MDAKRDGLEVRILFVIPELYNGGAERVVSRLASALSGKNEVHVALFVDPSVSGGMYPLSENVRVHVMDDCAAADHAVDGNPAIRVVRRIYRFRKLRKNLKPDVCISFLTSANRANVLTSMGERTIVSVRTYLHAEYDSHRALTFIKPAEVALEGKRADLVVAVSEMIRDEQINSYGVDPDKVITIYNTVQIEELQTLARKPVTDERFLRLRETHRVVVVTAGRLTRQKGQWHLIRAISRVRETHPEAALVVLGQGDQRDYLQSVVNANNLQEHVLIAGFADNPFAYMGQSDIYAFPSMYEGLSNALLEAMACGMPIVATDSASGVRELLAPSTDLHVSTSELEFADYGIITPRCSGNCNLLNEPLQDGEIKLAQAISIMIEDEALRSLYGKASFMRAKDFSYDKIIGQWAAAIGCEY